MELLQAASTKNEGHGHVFKRPDGRKTRCGGPALCPTCARDLAQLRQGTYTMTTQPTQEAPSSDVVSVGWRCFFCNEYFTDEILARDHFGFHGWEPGCVNKLVQTDQSRRAELVRTEAAFRKAIQERNAAIASTAGDTLKEQVADLLVKTQSELLVAKAENEALRAALEEIAAGTTPQRFLDDSDSDYFLRWIRDIGKLARTALGSDQ